MTRSDSKFWFDEAAAGRACEFFEKHLRHSKGKFAGQPFILTDWQRDLVIRPLFGWKRSSDNTRRYRRGYIEIPKKNGKTTLSSGIALYLLVADGERGAEVYSAAADRDQAAMVYREAASMVEQSPALTKRLRLIESKKRIVYQKTGSFYRALSRESKVAQGINIHGLIFDELHIQSDREMWDTLIHGGASRSQPLMLSITTAGEYDPESIGWEQHKYAEDVLSGMNDDDSFFALIFAAGKDDDWKAPETWHKANPSLGITINIENMEEACREAINTPSKLNAFLRYRLDLWTVGSEVWIDPEKWKLCSDPVSREDLSGRPCFGGLDLASKIDLASLCWCFPPASEGEPWKFLWRCWIPEDTMLERIRRDSVQYDRWAKAGWVETTPGNVVDYEWIKRDIRADAEMFGVQTIGFDPWNATQIALDLQSEGITMVEFRQGARSMSNPMKELERLYISRQLTHGGNPVVNWCATNTRKIEDVNENCRVEKSGRIGRIDPIVAAIIALGVAIGEQEEEVVSFTGF